MKFSRSDSEVVIVLLLVIVIACVLYPYIDGLLGDGKQTESVTSMLRKEKFSGKSSTTQYYKVDDKTYELFPFDPNTADSTQLLRLGLRPFQVRSIYRYRASGGYYRRPIDFAKVYGLTAKEFLRLKPYIRIAKVKMASELYEESKREGWMDEYDDDPASAAGQTHSETHSSYQRDTVLFPKKLRNGEFVNINTADTTMLKRIPGVGSYYAKRIVSMRERLGGFVSAKQLLEIEGIQESVADYAIVGKPDASTGVPEQVKQIRINHLDARQLSRHHYIYYAQAKHIVEYRNQKGNFHSAEELLQLPSFTPADVKRLAPYLVFD